MPEQSDIRHGQGVWHPVHANGVIDHIDYSEQEVWVKFYNNGNREVFSAEDIEGNWDWRLKQWVLTG